MDVPDGEDNYPNAEEHDTHDPDDDLNEAPVTNLSFNAEQIDPDLVATVAALGSYEGENYVKGEECAVCVTDLIKFLRIEDKKTCDMRRQIALTKAMETDLLPVLTTCFEDHDIIEAMMRLLVNLTMPVLLCFEQEDSGKRDKLTEKFHLEVNNYLRSYKELFVRFNVMKVFSSILGQLLELGKSGRSDDDDLMLERLLIIIRNILHVPSDTLEDEQFMNSLSSHDKLVLSIEEYGVADLLFYLCGSRDEEQHCLLCLEILSLIFRDFDSSILARQNTNQDNMKIDEELREIKMKEDSLKKNKVHTRNTRHSRFGGTFVVQGKKSITDKDLIYHKNIKKIKNLSFDEEKTIQRHTRFNAIAKDRNGKRFSTAQTRNCLKTLAQKFLDVCYNPIMKKAKSFLCRGQGTADCDESFYLWVCMFFMSFNRHVGFRLELVAETLSSDTFSYILQIIFKFHEQIKGFSSKMRFRKVMWAKRLHYAVQAYREMLENLNMMQSSKDSKIKGIAGIIQNIIFYQQEYRELTTMLLKQFDRSIFTKSYLEDLVECTHLYIRMLDLYTKSNTLIVQQTKKRPKKKKKTVKKKKNLLSEREMEEMWNGDIEKEVLGIISSGSISTNHVRPFDASSDFSMEQQRVLCKHNIQDLLKSGSFDEAVALFKAAQEVWPSSPSFGMPDMTIIDEVNVVKSIFLSREDIPEIMMNDGAEEGGVDPREMEMEGGEVHHVSEHRFQSNEYVMLYARPGIVKCYCYLLQFFETNPNSTNHAIAKMLYRIAHKIAMAPLMYQISFFVTLRKILSAPKIEIYKDIQKFAAFVVRKFTVSLKDTPMICVDTMFWKTPDDVLAIDSGYDPDKLNPSKKVEWSLQEEAELKELFDKWIDKARAIDLCEMIAQDMTTSSDKQRMDVKKKIIELALVPEENIDVLKKKPKNKVEWLPDEREALRNLYEDFRYERDPVALIQEKLDTKSRRKIIKELESLLGVRKTDLDVNRCIWTKDEDEELRILYQHKSVTLTGDSLLDAIQDTVPKHRTIKEIKDALIRLKLKRDENSSAHFWTEAELAVIQKHKNLLSKKECILKIKDELSYIQVDAIIQQLVRMTVLSTREGADLLIEITDMDSEDEEEEEEEDEEEYDFFDFPHHLQRAQIEVPEAVKWVTEVCVKTLENREDLLDYDTVFLIPRKNEHQECLANVVFQNFLKCLGALPPLSSYETYWKLTSEISDNVLRKAVSFLQGEAGDYSDSDHGEVDDIPQSEHAEQSSDDDMDSFFDKMRSQKVANEADNLSVNPKSYDLDSDLSDKENDSTAASSQNKRKKNISSDSDSDVGVSDHNVVLKKKRTAMLNFSDSEDD